ncbi:MAG: endonuclease/exonuclease/phosphatase family protein, partial [Pseudomonadota bacterium]
LIPLHADIYAFQEVQNDGFSDASAIASLTELLGDDYDFIRTGDGHTGCDVISVGLAYGNTVRPIGTGLVLSGGPFGTSRAGASRAPLAQVFEHAATGERITVVVNHFKSRRAPQENTGDANSVNSKGQGYWNPRRTESAAHLAASLEELGGNIDPDIAIVGDFNAHAYEDPLRVLENAGYTNLLKPAAGQQPPAYTYVHAGLAGALDHVLVSNGLVDQAFAFTWPIDADEPDVMDYRLRGTGATWFHATPFRASDHDPVVLDITF